jgi:hypothetical protein
MVAVATSAKKVAAVQGEVVYVWEEIVPKQGETVLALERSASD